MARTTRSRTPASTTRPSRHHRSWCRRSGRSRRLAARIGDGLWTTGPNAEIVEEWRQAGGSGPVYSQLTLCWAEDAAEAVKTAHRIWPNNGVPGQLSQDLPTPAHFEQAASVVTEGQIAESIPCGPDPEPVVGEIEAMLDAGVDHLHVHQIGPDQEGFCRFWSDEVVPRLRGRGA